MSVKNRYPFVACVLVTTVFLLSGNTPLWAGTTGKISGRITDTKTGEPLPGTNVIIEGTTLGAATDLEGYYVILNVPPGMYTLRASMIGYREVRVEAVRVSIELTTERSFQLDPTVLELLEAITVTAERTLIQKDITSTLSSVSAQEIAELPVESVGEVLQLQAGWVEGHMRGGRASEVAYLIDGVSVTDPFSGNRAIEVENMTVQELQVVSGAFNAEYGQAMSAIVNMVTKEGNNTLSGTFSMYAGDYLSQRSQLLYNSNENAYGNEHLLSNVEPTNTIDLQASANGPVPVLKNKLFFFTSARYENNEGFLYGRRVYNISDNPLDSLYTGPGGDNAFVSMNPSERLSLQGKLTFKIGPSIKLNVSSLWEKSDYREYNHAFRYNPDGDYGRFEWSYANGFTLTHTLNPKTFYTASLSNFFYDYKYYVFEDPYDPRYVDPDLLKNMSAGFQTGGTEMWHFNRNTNTLIGKFDITNQMTRTHQLKTGCELRRHKLFLHEFKIREKRDEAGIKIEPFQPDVPPITSPYNNRYTHHPIEAAIYVQDKMEFEDMIVNAGLRYDYFDSRGIVPLDLRDPNNSYMQREVWYKKATPKHQLSPRIGIAYPITDEGVIHLSYGHFFQIPTFENLYTDPEFEVEIGGLRTRMGYADLKPQKTVIYEIGLQQQLSENVAMDVTGYYKDIRNLLGTEIHELYIMGDRYARYVNRDYGNVRGVTFSLTRRQAGYLSASIDYTYQVAEGNASDPDAVFWDNQSEPPQESEKQVVPLDWDQTHTLNFTVTLSEAGNWGVSLLGRMGSGLPYTPAYNYQRTGFENSERKPSQYELDLKAHKDFMIGRLRYSIFLKVYNLFDRKNENDVYGDTGRAGYTLTQHSGTVYGPLTYDDFYTRSDFYSRPRHVRAGVTLGF
ncbi:MAG: TonB-dependent receptor [Gemmatimonadota bacterium]|nr:MAG: TonB-dependent receptor [Gemmatimonadota bacterium]